MNKNDTIFAVARDVLNVGVKQLLDCVLITEDGGFRKFDPFSNEHDSMMVLESFGSYRVEKLVHNYYVTLADRDGVKAITCNSNLRWAIVEAAIKAVENGGEK